MSEAVTHRLPTPASRAEPGARSASIRWRGAGYLTQVQVLSGRSLRALVSDPRTIIFALIQPLIMLGLFTQVFGSISGTAHFPAGVTYVDYLVPAILVNIGMQSALQVGVGLTTDMENGVLARFRAMPIRLSAVLVARSVSDFVRAAFQLLVMLVLAVAIFGFSPAGGVLGVLGAYLLALAVSWGLGWIFLAIATWLRNAELMQTVGGLATFPLMFASSAFVPTASLPSWLQAVATVNPLTYAVDASRHLALGTPVGSGAAIAVAISAVLAAVGAGFAVRGLKRPA